MGKKQRNLAVGKVEVPQGYFLKMAKHDYNNYIKALPREFYQNSIDAGASEIIVECDEEKRSITIGDNGSGMDLKTLRHKLLVLGGSKKGEGATGAFGKAKELLFFSWEKYEIKTRDLVCEGAGAHYTIKRSSRKVAGTKCTIWIPEEEDFDYYPQNFKDVATLFQTEVSIKVDGESRACRLTRGNLVRSTDWCKVYVNPEKTRSWYMNVRINGQWMFQKYTGNDVGQIVVELSRKSTEMLTSNRDGIKDKYSGQFDDLLREVMVEREEMLRPKPTMIRKVIKGVGNIRVNWEKIKKEVSERIHDAAVNEGVYSLSDMKGFGTLLREMSEVQSLQMALVADRSRENSIWDDESSIAFIGYEPHFIIDYPDSKDKVVKKFMKSRKASVLAECWTEVCKQVLIDIEWSGEFCCGFTFDSEKKAAFIKDDGIPVFLLNPLKVCKELPEIQPYINRAMLRRDLLSSARHEITHLYEKYHDGSFIIKFHWIEAQTWRSDTIYQKIFNSAFHK